MPNPKEQHRILLLIPLLIIIAALFLYPKQPKVERAFLHLTDQLATTKQSTGQSDNYPTNATVQTQTAPKATLFAFDPNSVTLQQLVALGFTPKQAQGVVNYRNAGAIFRTPEDFAKSYVITPEKFQQLRPYIQIATQSHPPATAPHPIPTSVAEQTTIVHSPATATLKTDSTRFQQLLPSIASTCALVELNSADSAQLVSIRGIGALTASRIIHYRQLLGGFSSSTQLQEISGMTEKNYLLILTQICVDTAVIQKIDINFALPKAMKDHPYLPTKTLNRVLKFRQLEGGWSNTEELIKQHILSREEAERLAPYLIFRAK